MEIACLFSTYIISGVKKEYTENCIQYISKSYIFSSKNTDGYN